MKQYVLIKGILDTRQNKIASILSKAQKLFCKEDFKEIQDIVFKKLEK